MTCIPAFNHLNIIEFAENLIDEVATDKTSEKAVSNEFDLNIDEEILKELKIESLQAQTDTAGGETLMQQQTSIQLLGKTTMEQH